MGTVAPPQPVRPAARARPEPRVIEARRRAANLHLFTYTVGSALFWVLWAAVSISAETWYWWALVPMVGWTLMLGLHLRYAYHVGDVSD